MKCIPKLKCEPFLLFSHDEVEVRSVSAPQLYPPGHALVPEQVGILLPVKSLRVISQAKVNLLVFSCFVGRTGVKNVY